MNWEPSDSSKLRDYHKKTGGKLLAYLRGRVPRLNGTTIESVALEAKHKEGCELIIREIELLLVMGEAPDDASSGTFAEM